MCPHPILRDLGNGICPVCSAEEKHDAAIELLTKHIRNTPEEPGRVYFLATRDRTLVKIGKTRSDGELRVRKLAGQSPVPLDLIAELDGYTHVERWFHRTFHTHNAHGEWFRFEGALKLLIEHIARTGMHPCIPQREVDRGKNVAPSELVPQAPPVAVPVPDELATGMVKLLPQLDDIEAERCRRSLSYFVRKAWPVLMPGIPLLWNWHLEEICKHVQCMLEEWMKKQRDPSYVMKAQNLIINCPPRSLKSTIVSICAPAWMWLQWPSWKALFISSNPRVAIRDARGCHALLLSTWYSELKRVLSERHPDGSEKRKNLAWDLDHEHDADGNFSNTSGGIRMAFGFKAMATGLGGDAIFVDDPNDMKKVVSETERDTVNDTWDLALCNRVNDYVSSIRVLIMQRGHEQDLTGHWLATMNRKRLVHLIMPLEFDVELVVKSPFGYKDPRKKKGDCMHPARFTPDVIEEERARLSTMFDAQMNQNPSAETGIMFKRGWWNFCTLIRRDGLDPLLGCKVEIDTEIAARPKGCDTKRPAVPIPFLDMLCITIDATFGSLEEDASNVGLLVIGVKGPDRFVIEDRTKARTFLDTCTDIDELVRDFPAASCRIIEKKANGAAVIEVLKSKIGGLIAIENNENHAIRWNAMVPGVHAGNWYILEHAPWSTAFVAEFAQAPKGSKDDRIDAASTLQKHFEMGGYVMAEW